MTFSDGWNRIAGWSGTSLSKVYLWGLDLSGTTQGAGGVGGLLSMLDVGTSVSYYPTYDGKGNVSESINSNGSGAAMLAAHFEYDPFGNLTAGTSGTAAAFPYRFSTKPQDPVSGLLYYGYRWYDPLTGRWPSREAYKTEGFDFQHALEGAVWSSCMAGDCTMGSITDSMAAAMLDHFKSDLLP
ncbi:MAG: hypothetical protein J0M04_10835 [Verrucomicrobia bacterium]|nr:hypothetical protein [Verrucomicrobiota bacterium]